MFKAKILEIVFLIIINFKKLKLNKTYVEIFKSINFLFVELIIDLALPCETIPTNDDLHNVEMHPESQLFNYLLIICIL